MQTTPLSQSDTNDVTLACHYGMNEACLVRMAKLGITPADVVRLVKEYGDDVVALIYEVVADFQAGKLSGWQAAPTLIGYLLKYRDRLGKAIAEVMQLLGLDKPPATAE